MGYNLSVIILFVLWPVIAVARPISYPGGWTLMTQNNWESNRLHLHYSPTARYSLGVSTEYLRDEEQKNFNLQLNRLLFRKNTKHSQANVYLKSEGGIAVREDDYEPNLKLGFSADWETRRFFTSYEISERYSGDFDDGSFHQKSRLGLAPYLANYGAVHAWFMIQFEHHPEQEKEFQFRVTPLIRIFKGEYLAELGVDDEKQVLFNFIFRY